MSSGLQDPAMAGSGAAVATVDISVVICTYTEARWDDLVAAVDSCFQQTLPPREVIVVVDYNLPMLERVRRELPRVLAVANAGKKGLSAGRNTGIATARGEFIAFLDDDATADPDWLAQMARHCDDERVLGVGSAVNPVWLAGRPRWFPEEFDWVVGCTYRGAPTEAAVVRNAWGGCMCVRRVVFDEVGGFIEGIGRVDEKPLGCEDTELCIRAGQRWPGRVFVYEPRARIYHRVPEKRGRWRYFFARCYAEGLSKARVAQQVGAGVALATERAYTRTVLPAGVLHGLCDAVRGRPDGLGRAAAIVSGVIVTAAGYLRGRLSGGPA
jgi:GT2 family glycosyltransferase